MVNFYDILKNVCTLSHEEIPPSFATAGLPYSEIKQYIQNTVEEVCSRFPWKFRERIYSFNTVQGQKEYDFAPGIEPSNIIKDGVKISGTNLPLYFILHSALDSQTSGDGKPLRYSVYASKLIIDPVPDGVYAVQIKYLTVNYAFDSTGEEKTNLILEDDVSIIPDRFIKVVEWGAYSLYRQNFKPDNKYELARAKFLGYLSDMQKQNEYSGDSSPVIVIQDKPNNTGQMIRDFFNPGY